MLWRLARAYYDEAQALPDTKASVQKKKSKKKNSYISVLIPHARMCPHPHTRMCAHPTIIPLYDSSVYSRMRTRENMRTDLFYFLFFIFYFLWYHYMTPLHTTAPREEVSRYSGGHIHTPIFVYMLLCICMYQSCYAYVWVFAV